MTNGSRGADEHNGKPMLRGEVSPGVVGSSDREAQYVSREERRRCKAQASATHGAVHQA